LTPDPQSAATPFTVVLVNWRNQKQTLRCMRAVKGWKSLQPQLVVVDNESTPESACSLASELRACELIATPLNRGYGGGNNLAIEHSIKSSKNHILLLNSDAEITEATMGQLLSTLNRHPEISILGPIIRQSHGNATELVLGGRDIAIHASSRVAATSTDLLVVGPSPLIVDYVPGTVFLVRSCVFADVGLLDERYFFAGEIADFCQRARDKGYKAYIDPEAEARHDLARADRLRETLYSYYSLRNRFLYVRKHYKSQKLMYFTVWTLRGARALAGALLLLRFARARAILLALGHGLGNRFGDQNAKFV
jgi:GT2 family glycosyltransferase